jgi:sensor histidine kinase YesM
MRFPKPPLYQYIGFWISMPFIVFALSYIMYEERMFHDWRPWAVTYPLIYGIGYLSWRSHYVYDHYLRIKFPSLDQTNKRLLYKIPVNLLVMSPSVLVIFLVFHVFHILGYSIREDDLKFGLITGLTVNIIFESLWEVIYIIDKFKEATAEKQLIEKLQLQQEFSNLKQKVNPHFLFNCFNTLSSLISVDKTQAEKFLDELSKVYRYLLRNNESGMSSVDRELQFINSYYKLLKTRYGNGFELQIHIDSKFKEYQLPSLSLQLLVENAVKHNIVSKQSPVQIQIKSSQDARLIIENNLNKKINIAESTGIGLSNIREKYRLLNRNDVFIEETEDKFIVSVPLIPRDN